MVTRDDKEQGAAGRQTNWPVEAGGRQGAFQQVVRHARSDRPQRVSVRSRDAVVIVSAEEFDRLAPTERRLPFVQFMESLHLDGLDLTRDPDRGRDVEL